jgi:VWFA-related protein
MPLRPNARRVGWFGDLPSCQERLAMKSFAFGVLVFVLAALVIHTYPARAAQSQASQSADAADQTPPPLLSESHVVLISVAVRDSQGQNVQGLRKQDFTVFDDGKPRDFQLFPADSASSVPSPSLGRNFFSNRYVPPAPRVTAILLDSANTPVADQSYAREQAIKAMQSMPLDQRIAIYSLGTNLKVLQDYTTDRALLLKALNDYTPGVPLSANPMQASTAPYSAERGGGKNEFADNNKGPAARAEAQYYFERRIDISLATLLSIATHITGASHRNSIIWITGGLPLRSDEDGRVRRALDAINDANIALYPIDARGLSLDPHDVDNYLVMQEFARSTGGQAFYNRNDLDAAINEAIAAPRFTYLLGFYLDPSDLDGRFHKLRVSVDRPGISLSYRSGYTAAIDPNARKNNREPLDAELLATQDSAEIGIDAKVTPVSNRGKNSLQLALALDRTTLRPANGGKITLAELFAEIDPRGRTVARITESISFDMPGVGRDPGFTQSIPLQSGAEKVKVIIQDKSSGHTGSLTIPLANLSAN